jgi:hypothetical protein
MIKIFGVLLSLLFLTQACSTISPAQVSSPQEPVVPPTTETDQADIPQPIVETTLPEVSQSTADVLSVLPSLTPSMVILANNPVPENGITLEDKGKTFKMKVGDSFLLNLGTDTYDWIVTVDNVNVLNLKMGVMAIQGAQGIYDALASGTATLSATGDPICLRSNPPCASPSILFTVKIIVE